MTYIGQTPEGKYTFFVDIERPEVRKLEDLHFYANSENEIIIRIIVLEDDKYKRRNN